VPKRSRSKKEKAVEAIEHQDRRPNIPTSELASFVAEDEERPGTVLYQRDPSLDPQLVWKGKDELDHEDLSVPVVPVYIQEKIHPLAVIEALRQTAALGEPEPEQFMFEQFNGFDTFEAKLDFYQHEANWTNRMILGDSLLVMTSLAEKEGLRGKVQMIYVDPPYGIKFGSNWQVSTRRRDVKDGKVEDAAREPEVIRAFRDTWELGIHSYLAYLRDRFTVARELLTETGSLFVQIGDENVHLVRCVLEEVFGSENFVSQISFTKAPGGLESGQKLSGRLDYLLWYAKNRESVKYRSLFMEPSSLRESGYNFVLAADGTYRKATNDELDAGVELPEGDDFAISVLMTKPGPGAKYEARFQGQTFDSGRRWWGLPKPSLERVLLSGRVHATARSIRFLRKAGDFPARAINNLWVGLAGAPNPVFVVQTNPMVTERCILMSTDPGDLVLDPTCGSGTTAYVAERWGRRWITIDTSRVALALSRTRLMTSHYPFYFLLDSPEGAAKEAEITGQAVGVERTKYGRDVRKGFVHKRVPHITLKLFANNEEIDEIHARFQERLESLRGRLNKLAGQSWEDWEIPREANDGWSKEVRRLHAEWWDLRRERQAEMDASIARRAEQEILVDQPYEDSTTVRVTGPFTVESLAPHRVLSTDEARPATERAGERETAASFTTTILDNLRKAGVQNTKRGERLVFDRLEPFAGRWIQAAGEYTDAEGEKRRVAISLGPEHGAVGPQQIREAAKEAVQGVGFDLLLVLGFAFDPHAGEAAEAVSPDGGGLERGFVAERRRQFGKLPVLLVRMNPDLAMGDELLKKTGAGNLFMVFGEPDITIRDVQDDKLVVEIKGVDIYDPTTGEIRSSSTDDIACWFLDTAYDGESFFVRHAYFTGTDEPYEKLKRALRAEIDPDAWAELYRTDSRPFTKPATGRIAIKVINHYGDEVLKVYEVAD
jgi:adenine-specific DNA-methyltransferase